MPTVIDSLIVELAMDPKKFTQGQKEAVEQLRRFQQESTRAGKSIEADAKKYDGFFSLIKSGFMGVLGGIGVRSVIGLVNNLTQADAAVGRTSHAIGMSVHQLAAWEAASRQAGGAVGSMTSAFQGLRRDIDLANIGAGGGGFRGSLGYLQQFTRIDLNTFTDNLRDMGKVFQWIATAAEGIPGTAAEKAAILAQIPGMNPDTINFILRGRKAMDDYVAAGMRVSNINAAGVQSAHEYVTALAELETAFESLKRAAMAPVITPAAVAMTTLAGGDVAKLFTWRRILTEGHRATQWLWGSGAVPRPAAAPTPPAPTTGVPAVGSSLRIKSDAQNAGAAHPGTMSLAALLQAEVPGLNRFTAFNDRSHAGSPSPHNRGLALDFTLNNPRDAATVAQQIRTRLAAMGINATVLDEYTRPSPFSTGPHIHVQLNSQADAARLAALQGGGLPPGGAGAAAPGSGSTVNVGATINIYPPTGDPTAIGVGVRDALQRWGGITSPANMGQQG